MSMTASVNINIQTTESTRLLIDQAAKALGQNRSEFILDVAQQRARDVLLDRTQFQLGDEQQQRFNQLLDSPLPGLSGKNLERLLNRQAPWEV